MLIKLCLYLVFSCDPYLHSFSATYGKDLGWSHRPTQCDLIIPCIHYKGGQNIKENTEKSMRMFTVVTVYDVRHLRAD